MRGLSALLSAASICICAWLVLTVADPVLHTHTGALKSVVLVVGLLALLGAVRLARTALVRSQQGGMSNH